MRNKKIYVIGDIHGGFKSLVQVLERSPFDNKIDQIIFLGDYVDGWGESAQVVEYLIELQEEAEGRHIFILGNHDVWLLEYLKFSNTPSLWTEQGGMATLKSYIGVSSFTKDKHIKFLEATHHYYVDDQNRGFVHGGYSDEEGLGYASWHADYYWNRKLWNIACSGNSSQTIPKILRPHKEIYIGHTTTMMYGVDTPMNKCNVWNLDTGGGYGGKLTIMDIDTKEYWQSDLLKELYPNEIGR